MWPNHENFNFLTVTTPLKLNIYTKITNSWLVHAFVYDLKGKKWGHLRTILQPLGIIPGGWKYFVNIFAKTKMFLKIFWDITLGARNYQFMQKTRHQKSHAIVPLITKSLHFSNRYIFQIATSLRKSRIAKLRFGI